MKQVDVNGLTPIQTKVLMMIKENPTSTRSEIASICELGTTRTGEIMKELKELGKIERIGGKKGGYWKVK